jgi:hypothetical protein
MLGSGPGEGERAVRLPEGPAGLQASARRQDLARRFAHQAHLARVPVPGHHPDALDPGFHCVPAGSAQPHRDADIRELLQAVGLLAGDRGDEIEVLIDVEDGEPRGFGCGGDQEVRDGRSAVLP